MELAKAAELNGYPGPMHTLELAQPLELSAQQKQDTEALLARPEASLNGIGRAAGFTACDPYPESEIPPDFDARWVYMRRDL